MRNSWHRAECWLFDRGDENREGSVTAYLRYDLRSWTFGIRFENDPCWYDLFFEFGPVSISFCYWRRYVALLDT